jgi:hypothetical protein
MLWRIGEATTVSALMSPLSWREVDSSWFGTRCAVAMLTFPLRTERLITLHQISCHSKWLWPDDTFRQSPLHSTMPNYLDAGN